MWSHSFRDLYIYDFIKDIYAKDRTEVKVKQSSKKGEEWEGGEWDSDSEVWDSLCLLYSCFMIF